MNVEILDNDVFAPLDPENVSRYLKGQNWKVPTSERPTIFLLIRK